MLNKGVKVSVLKELTHRNCPIYIRRLGRTTFEFLIIRQYKLYGGIPVVIKPPRWYRRFLIKPYTEKESQENIRALFETACGTIDKLRDEGRA